eukprot:scpid31418/ scgid1564/ Phosphatidylinositol N-acetylglucosaminyltransferase subunit Q; N-acetylglucosamyl transferase component GPI1; Phosphatidylinositol-glycan biosynthesis class Q protein
MMGTDSVCSSGSKPTLSRDTAGMVILVRSGQHHRTAENVELLRNAVGESAARRDARVPVEFTLSRRARAFLTLSRLAATLVALHVCCFAWLARVCAAHPSVERVLCRTACGCRALQRAKACLAYRTEDQQQPAEQSVGAGGGAGDAGIDGDAGGAGASSGCHDDDCRRGDQWQLRWARQPSLRLVWLLVADIFLGIVLMAVLVTYANVIASELVTNAELTAVWLRSLINWLMGVPAGLKLNNQLSEFLGRFFLYHIYLWGIYVRLVAPVLAPLLRCVASLGVLGGATLLLCALSDLLSAFVFHAYCFYIYAGRVFGAQRYVLAALLRLFAGRKWNVLRRRVDSLESGSTSSSPDQYLLGTLLFTVVLWLLPTTLVFYSVFAAVRLVVLAAHCLLAWLVLLLDHMPLCEVLRSVCAVARLRHLDFRLETVPPPAGPQAGNPPDDSSPFIALRLNVCPRSGDRYFSLTALPQASAATTGDGDDACESQAAQQALVACGRPASVAESLVCGCPYVECARPGFIPSVDVVGILSSLARGSILHAPTESLCHRTPSTTAAASNVT